MTSFFQFKRAAPGSSAPIDRRLVLIDRSRRMISRPACSCLVLLLPLLGTDQWFLIAVNNGFSPQTIFWQVIVKKAHLIRYNLIGSEDCAQQVKTMFNNVQHFDFRLCRASKIWDLCLIGGSLKKKQRDISQVYLGKYLSADYQSIFDQLAINPSQSSLSGFSIHLEQYWLKTTKIRALSVFFWIALYLVGPFQSTKIHVFYVHNMCYGRNVCTSGT